MATQAQLDQIRALVKNGDFDQADEFFRGEWSNLWLTFAQYLLVQGNDPTHLENTGFSESWNLHQEAASSFGGDLTHLYGVPTADQAAVILPVTTLFVPPKGYRFHFANGSATHRAQLDPDGTATIDGASTLDVEPLGSVELVFEGVTGREFRVVASSSSERAVRVPLGAADTAAGILSWQNPFGAAILVRVVLDVTTAATGALTADLGQAATAVTSDNLVDGVDLGTAAGVFSSHDDQGSNGRTYRRVGSGEFVTGSMSTGAAAGLVGNAHIFYRLA